MAIPALAEALVILLAYIVQYLILSLKQYIADRISEAYTRNIIVAIIWNISREISANQRALCGHVTLISQ